ncbi:hypothetical protein PoB_004957000 [Plakobranchus ocellatus]|uniref:Uncharacterized protein n=1 Tax=Plakobranchus ocellatus TaxID=259542 RepID=A0AAV4BR45_9GAST|nr:hypothetical protein PoB_004957000 [Plakobranchus ocellatus]
MGDCEFKSPPEEKDINDSDCQIDLRTPEPPPDVSGQRTLQTSPQQGDPRLSGPPSGQGAGSGARTRDRRVPADLRADSQATVLPTPPPIKKKAYSLPNEETQTNFFFTWIYSCYPTLHENYLIGTQLDFSIL